MTRTHCRRLSQRAFGIPQLFAIAVICLLEPGRAASAAGHSEITVIPLGMTGVEKGIKERTFRLAEGPDGPWPQAVIFVTSQPWMDVTRPAPLEPSSQPEAEKQRKQVPATILFTVAGKELPAWTLEPRPTGYVVNLATIKAGPQFDKGLLVLTIDLQTDAPGLNLSAVGSPDPLLLNDTTDGPLSGFESAAKDADAKAYFAALILEIGEKVPEARAAYQKLVACTNERVARMARRSGRLMSYLFRHRRLSGNFNEHRRWALYLQQCGLLAPAFTEFDECRIADPDDTDAHYLTGEAADRLGAPAPAIFNHMIRTAIASRASDPSDWYLLVVILGNRGGKKLTATEIVEIKDHFLLAEGMIWGATHGAVRIVPTFLTITDESNWSYRFRGDGVLGPSDDIVAERGWFDGVFSIIPQVEGSAAGGPIKIATVGGDEGPNGAAMSCLPHDAKWIDFLQAFYEQYDWAARVGEVGVCFPEVDRARYSGAMPVCHKGYAYRSALARGFTDSMHRRPKISDEPAPDTHLRMWNVEGPFPVQAASNPNGAPKHHVTDPLPPSQGPSVKLVSRTDFINLAKLFPNAGAALARASCWVFSPADQDVRMWLGQNDGMAVWLNGRCVHEGHYYSAGAYEDKNLVDTIASYARLKAGWNELRVVVESCPAPRNWGWGFSVRFCNWNNQPLPGLAYLNDRPTDQIVEPATNPKVGGYYSWENVKGDYFDSLPQLSAADLASFTGVKGLSVASEIHGLNGYVALVAPDRKEARGNRLLRSAWQTGRDSDVVLNNVLDWARESCAALHFRKDGHDHDLLLVKPESADHFLTLLIESPEAKTLFKGAPPTERILGYVLLPAGLSKTALLVAEVCLGEEKNWPTDEEDLLTPLAPVYIPNKGIKPPSTSQPAGNP